MRYFYYNEEESLVTITIGESTSHGVLFGSIADSDFRQTHTTFLVQSLLKSAGISASGVTIKTQGVPAVTPTSTE